MTLAIAGWLAKCMLQAWQPQVQLAQSHLENGGGDTVSPDCVQ